MLRNRYFYVNMLLVAILLRSNTLYFVKKLYICGLIMRFLRYIPILLAFTVLFSCREASSFFGYNAVVKVGDKSLRTEEIASAMPKGLKGDDSVSYVEQYIDRWVIRQLKLQEAELIFSSSEADIDRMVEEYRQSLLIRKIEQYYLDRDIDFQITDSDIEEYYNANKSEFRLSHTVVKGYIVNIPSRYRRKDWVLSMLRGAHQMDSERFREVEQVCKKNNFKVIGYDQWVDFSEFLGYLPILRSADHRDMLRQRNLQRIDHNSVIYAFRITDYLEAGDFMPLFMAKDKIVTILAKRREGEVIRNNEQRMVSNAEYNGTIKFYRDSEEDKTVENIK